MKDFYERTSLYFDEIEHKYYIVDNKTQEITPIISTTQLMTKHGISTNYDGVDPDILQQAAQFGILQHSWLEKYFKGDAVYENLSIIAQQGIDVLIANNMESVMNEKKVYNNFMAGTVDMISMVDNKFAIIDFKFTSNYNINSVMWQLNIYKRLVKQNLGIDIELLYCLWYNKSKSVYELREVKVLDEHTIDTLFDSELVGKNYSEQVALEINSVEKQLELDNSMVKLFELQEMVKKQEVIVDKVKKELSEAMELFGVKSYETKNFKITLVSGGSKVSYDNKALQKAYGELGGNVSEFSKETTSKSYIKITDKRKQ